MSQYDVERGLAVANSLFALLFAALAWAHRKDRT